MSVSRVHRLIRLITAMQSDRGRSATELAEELGISRRTFFRDLNLLKEAGVPYFFDPERGYRISERFFLPPVNLTVPETLGLLMLGESVSTQPRQPYARSCLSAIRKLLGTVPEPIRSACLEMMEAVSFDPGPVEAGRTETAHYADLQRCIDEQRACRIVYDPVLPGEDELDTMLEPYLLHFSSRAWYVLGRSETHREVRMFKLGRMQRVEPSERHFLRPASYRVEDKLGKAWRLIPEGREYDVEIEFSPMVARNAYEVRWHPTQSHELLPDGGCRMRFRVDGFNEIAWWVCGYADQAEVIKPRELREKVAGMLRAAADRYV